MPQEGIHWVLEGEACSTMARAHGTSRGWSSCYVCKDPPHLLLGVPTHLGHCTLYQLRTSSWSAGSQGGWCPHQWGGSHFLKGKLLVNRIPGRQVSMLMGVSP